MLELMRMTWLKLRSLFKGRGGINRRVLLVGALFIALGGILFYFGSPSQGVSLEVDPPGEPVLIGIPFELEVRLLNNSQSTLNNTRVALGLPKGLALFEDSQKVNVIRDLGEINSGGGVKTSFTLIALPTDESNAHQVSVSVTYALGSLSAEFTKKAERKLEVLERDINLELDVPDTISVGQEFQAAIRYKNLIPEAYKEKELPSLALMLEGSQDFLVVASEPVSIDSNQSWVLEEGESKQISILGRVSDKSGDVFMLKGRIVLEFGGVKYMLEEKEAEILLAPPPLSFDLSLDDARGFVMPGDLLIYNVRYWNNTSADLKDVVIRAQLMGSMFDIQTLRTDGSFNELSQTISWTSGKFSKLAEIKQGSEGVFSFSIRTKEGFPTGSVDSDTRTLKVKGIIESPTITQGLSTDRTTSSDVEETKIASSVTVDARAYFRDADSGILNQGPFPPRVDQATDYSIHLEVAGHGSDLEEVSVITRLGNGVTLVSLGEGGAGLVPEYNESTREIVWRLGTVAVPDGTPTGKLETIFQVEATPDISMAGQYMPLLGITTVSAKDTFTGADLAATDGALNTRLSDDQSVSSEEGKVIH